MSYKSIPRVFGPRTDDNAAMRAAGKWTAGMAVLCMMMAASPTRAALIDRGTHEGIGGINYHLIYDDTLNLTWVDYTFGSEAAGASGFGHTSYNQSTWGNTLDWADTLEITVNGQNFDDWRLPRVVPVNDTNFAYDGSTDYGYNITRTDSELAHLYHMTLGNLSKYDTTGQLRGIYGLQNTDLFTELVGSPGLATYFTGSIYPDGTNNPFGFAFSEGLQHRTSNQSGNQEFGLAVRVGDVPEPTTMALLAVGLGLAAAGPRWRRQAPGPTAEDWLG